MLLPVPLLAAERFLELKLGSCVTCRRGDKRQRARTVACRSQPWPGLNQSQLPRLRPRRTSLESPARYLAFPRMYHNQEIAFLTRITGLQSKARTAERGRLAKCVATLRGFALQTPLPVIISVHAFTDDHTRARYRTTPLLGQFYIPRGRLSSKRRSSRVIHPKTVGGGPPQILPGPQTDYYLS